MRIRSSLLCLSLAATLELMPSAAHAGSELWVYTSVYKEFIAPIVQAFEKKHPEIDVQVFQGGSERTMLEALKRDFTSVRHAKPPASRKESSELYVVAMGFRGVPTPR